MVRFYEKMDAWSLVSKLKVTWMHIWFKSDCLSWMSSFPILYSWHTYPNPTLAVVQKGHSGQKKKKKNCNFLKTVLLKLNFQEKDYLYATCLFYIIFLCFKCLLSQFFSHGICLHISILRGVQRGRIRG